MRLTALLERAMAKGVLSVCPSVLLSHRGSVATYVRRGGKYYTRFSVNSTAFTSVKKTFKYQLRIDEVNAIIW